MYQVTQKISQKIARRVAIKFASSYKLWNEIIDESEDNELELNKNDIFLASFPRSGNTWVRNIIAHILYPPEQIQSLKDLNYLVPDLHKEIPEKIDYNTTRILKTHRPYAFRHGRKTKGIYNKVIYIVRHPLNVIRSLYHYKLYNNPKITLNQVVYEVVTSNNQWGASWQEHLLSWKAMEDEIDITFIKYEDLEKMPLEKVIHLAEFIGHSINYEQAKIIVLNSSIEAMIAMEKKGSIRGQSFEFIRRNPEKRKIKEDLDENLKEVIRDAFKYTMKIFDYKIDLG